MRWRNISELAPSVLFASRTVIAALAASIAVKGLLQAPVVEPELADGAPTGSWLVTIGDGRPQALRLLAKRKTIAKTQAVRCVVDLANDPHEISIDENVTRTEMHPADQFEAFKKLADERGLSAQDIGARFGVSAQVVRQRLRLGAVSPKLMAAYREGEVTLEVLMAFAVSEDHERRSGNRRSANRGPAHGDDRSVTPRFMARSAAEHHLALVEHVTPSLRFARLGRARPLVEAGAPDFISGPGRPFE